MSQQPEAEKLAYDLDTEYCQGRITNHTGRKAATELRRLHFIEVELRAQVERLQAAGRVAASAMVSMEIVATWRDYVLHGRGNLESVLDNDQTNEVLSVFDDMASELRSVGVNKTIPPASELLAALQGILACVNVRIDDPRCAQFDAARAIVAKAHGINGLTVGGIQASGRVGK